MSRKGTKIKRYGSIYGRNNGSFIMLLVMAAGVVAFGLAGWFLYTPIYNLIMGMGDDSPITTDPSSVVSQPSAEVKPVEENTQIETIEKNSMAAIYIPADKLADSEFLISSLDTAAAAGFNTVVTEAKDVSGKVLYKSENNIAKSVGIAAENAYDAAKTTQTIKAKGLSPAVKLHVFRDSLAPTMQRDMAVHYYDTEIYWFDNSPELGGKPWLDPYSESARKYIIEIIEELAESGFEIIMLDSVQFPSGVALDKAGFADENGKSKNEILAQFIKDAQQTAEAAGSRIMLCCGDDVLAPGAETQNEWLYGGDPTDLFTEQVVMQIDADSSVWGARLSQLDEATDSELFAMIPAYAADGTLVATNELTAAVNQTAAEGYLLYSPNGYYKFG